MPYVRVRVTRTNADGSPVTREQKAVIVREVTDTLVRVLDKKPEHTHVVIEEVDLDNWGFAGNLTSEQRVAQASPPVRAAGLHGDDSPARTS
jgi:4-oxalocrotonate tautomerase